MAKKHEGCKAQYILHRSLASSPPLSLSLTIQPGLALIPDPWTPDQQPLQTLSSWDSYLRLSRLLTAPSTTSNPWPLYRARQSRPPRQLWSRPLRGNGGTGSPRSSGRSQHQSHTSPQLNLIVENKARPFKNSSETELEILPKHLEWRKIARAGMGSKHSKQCK